MNDQKNEDYKAIMNLNLIFRSLMDLEEELKKCSKKVRKTLKNRLIPDFKFKKESNKNQAKLIEAYLNNISMASYPDYAKDPNIRATLQLISYVTKFKTQFRIN